MSERERRLWIDTKGHPVITTTANGARNATRWGWTLAMAIPVSDGGCEAAYQRIKADHAPHWRSGEHVAFEQGWKACQAYAEALYAAEARETPTDDEREALAQMIADAEAHPHFKRNPSVQPLAGDYRAADAILAAGFRRQGPITDEQVEAAAHALFDASQELGQENDWSDPLPDEWREAWRDAARAALEAARED